MKFITIFLLKLFSFNIDEQMLSSTKSNKQEPIHIQIRKESTYLNKSITEKILSFVVDCVKEFDEKLKENEFHKSCSGNILTIEFDNTDVYSFIFAHFQYKNRTLPQIFITQISKIERENFSKIDINSCKYTLAFHIANFITIFMDFKTSCNIIPINENVGDNFPTKYILTSLIKKLENMFILTIIKKNLQPLICFKEKGKDEKNSMQNLAIVNSKSFCNDLKLVLEVFKSEKTSEECIKQTFFDKNIECSIEFLCKLSLYESLSSFYLYSYFKLTKNKIPFIRYNLTEKENDLSCWVNIKKPNEAQNSTKCLYIYFDGIEHSLKSILYDFEISSIEDLTINAKDADLHYVIEINRQKKMSELLTKKLAIFVKNELNKENLYFLMKDIEFLFIKKLFNENFDMHSQISQNFRCKYHIYKDDIGIIEIKEILSKYISSEIQNEIIEEKLYKFIGSFFKLFEKYMQIFIQRKIIIDKNPIKRTFFLL